VERLFSFTLKWHTFGGGSINHLRVKELAAWLESAWEGEGDRVVRRVASLEDAGPDDIAYVTRGPALRQATVSSAACLLVPEDYQNETQRTVIRTGDPRVAAARVIPRLHPRIDPPPGIHPTAVLGPGVIVGKSVSIGPLAVLGAGVHVGDGTVIGPGATIGDYVRIGEHCVIHPRVTIYRDVTVGNRVVLHAGCVIGADGFGFMMVEGSYEKFPQVGRVEIGDQVEIGANSCVDRAALGVTVIGEGTKIDNLVHIAHNCRIGRHVAIAAQAGIAGSVVVEDYAVIGGQVGIADKVRIESRAVLGAQCGVPTSKIIRKGQVVWGTPARPLKQYLAQLAILSGLAKKGDET
jgi:UDP-3-O-[3-hydroxymyristoyl] glucosamine N-acyltransferase